MNTSHIDLLSLIGHDVHLARAAATDGGEYAGPCPFCGGKDRFRVWPNAKHPNYWCRQCNAKGDAITYMQKRDGLSFQQACSALNLESEPFSPVRNQSQRQARPAVPDMRSDYPALASDAWQQAAQEFATHSESLLHAEVGQRALAYLLKRGISESVIRETRLGYNSKDQRVQWGEEGIWLPRGIVIPWWIGDKLWRVKIRRPQGDPKYVQAKGGANGLYLSDTFELSDVVLLTEGEFDSLVIASQVTQPNVKPVATGSSKAARVSRWVVHLSLASKVILAFDNDTAGQEATNWWQQYIGKNTVVLRPLEKDITDMYLNGHDLDAWLASAL